jgi:hypothetical protein
MAGVYDNIIVDEDGKLLPEYGQKFLNAVSKKLEEKEFTCLGIKVTDTPNYLASPASAEAFKSKDETFDEHKARAPGWHAMWMPLLETLTDVTNIESQKILQNSGIPPYAAGDPTNYIKVALDNIRPQIEDLIEGDFLSFISRNLQKVLSGLGDLVEALIKVITTGGAGFKNFVNILADIFEDEGEEFIEKFKKSMKDKKKEIVEGFIALFIEEQPEIPSFQAPGPATVLEYFGIVLDPDKPLTNEDIVALVFPGIPRLSIPQGMLIIFIKIITTFIEIIVDLITNGALAFVSLGELFGLLLQGQFAEIIKTITGGLVEFIMEKFNEKIPEMFEAPTFLCSLLAFLELGVKIFTVGIIGHIVGPGLIFQAIAFLIIA